jgi:poly(3-hydroxybutyrate) depolymerase
MATIGSNRRFSIESKNPSFPSVAFLWPALAAEQASEFAAAIAKEFAKLAGGSEPQQPGVEPEWTTRNEVTLELESVRLRDFSTSTDGVATLVCAPFALHGATIADFAPRHSLVAALQGAGVQRILVTDWRSATATMRFLSIDNYLADLNVLVDQLGAKVDLVGLCQGGWLALVFAARFPAKVRKLVLAGAPIDIEADDCALTRLARGTPTSLFSEFVEVGEGRVLGRHSLEFWGPRAEEREVIHRVLQVPDHVASALLRQLEARFLDWYAWTVDLPGVYFLQVVEQVYKENRLATGRFVALGQCVDLTNVSCPIYLLAAHDDDLVAPGQVFATARLVGTASQNIQQAIAPCPHLGLFMGRATLTQIWPRIARWLAQPATMVKGAA